MSTNSFLTADSARDYHQSASKALGAMDCYLAADLFKKALQLNPYYKDALSGAGEAYFCMGNFQEARKYFDQALTFEPKNISFLLRLADIKMQLSNSPKESLGAEFYLRQAYELAPRDSRVLMAYGDYQLKLGKNEVALAYYDKAKRSDDNFLAYLKIADIYRRWKNYEKALENLLKAENLNSMDYRTNFALGNFFLETKKFDEAKRYYELTLKFYPQFREGLYKIIQFYILQDDFPQAMIKINELLKLEPENPLLYYHMALCYENLRRHDDAIRFLQQGQQYDFSDEILRLKAEEIAVKHLPLGHRLRKTLAAPYLKKGTIAYTKNQTQHAILYLKRGLRINPLSIPTRQKLATIYREKGWIDLFLRTLEAGLFSDQKNQHIKDQIALNKKFLWNTLAYEKKMDQYKLAEPLPTLFVSNILSDQDNRHFLFEPQMRELLLQSLYNTHSVFVKELEAGDRQSLAKKGQLLLRVHYYEDERKFEISAELVALATGNIFRNFSVRRYGNDRVIEGILQLSKEISEAVMPFGKILDITDDTALINLGERHRVKLKDRFYILKSKAVIDDYFSGGLLKSHQIIGEAEVTRLDENMAQVQLFKSHQVVFNLINLNDIIMVKKDAVKPPQKNTNN